MRVLGLDPGLKQTGWGVIETQGERMSFLACGAIGTRADDPFPARLTALFRGVEGVLAAHALDEAAVEETFLNRNPGSTLKLGQARGVVLLAPALGGLPVAEYATRTVKQTVAGYGAAAKSQVETMVRMLLPGCDPQSTDAADALAVAICHAQHALHRALTQPPVRPSPQPGRRAAGRRP